MKFRIEGVWISESPLYCLFPCNFMQSSTEEQKITINLNFYVITSYVLVVSEATQLAFA